MFIEVVMKNLYIVFLVLISLTYNVYTETKIQSYDGLKFRFKHFSKVETSSDISSSQNKFGKTLYSLNRMVAKKLAFFNYYRNFLKKDQILVNEKGEDLIEKGKIYIKLFDKIQLANIDKISNKNYSFTFGIPDLDRIFQINGGIRINELYKFKNINLISEISIEALNLREQLEKTYVIEFDENVDVLQFCIDLASDPNVEYAEPVSKNWTTATPNDTEYSKQFALTLMQCPAAWDIFKGQNATEEILIGVCDSGVDWDHPDLVNNLKHNLGEDANNNGYVIYYNGANWVFDPGDINNIDDDGNGKIDDFVGWNFYTGDGSIENNPTVSILNEHGTHVAGICNASTNNTTGVAGLPWNLKFLPTKHGDNDGLPSIYNGYEGMVYLAEFGADIINCSWGGIFYSKTEESSVIYSNSLGSIIIAATGNNNTYGYFFPASHQNVISVSSVNSQNVKSSYSNYGNAVDISAYGGEEESDGAIYSTMPDNTYGFLDGTSMASPYVAALFAYYKSYRPNSSNFDITKAILGSSTNVYEYNPGYEGTLGHGIINAYNAITATNPDITHNPYIDLLWIAYTEPGGNGQINNGETIDWELNIKNFNQLYGTDNFKYFITTNDPDVTILNGTGTISLGADAYLLLDNVKFQIANNCPHKIVKFDIKFDINNGFEYNYVSSILILNSSSQNEALAYIAYDPTSNLKGPCKFKINDPNNFTVLADQGELDWVRAGTYFNNLWYGFDSGNNLITINPNNGSRTLVKNFNSSISGLTYDFLSRKFYGIDAQDALYNLDIPNGNLINYYDVLNYYINLAADKNGNLYSIELSGNSLYKINRYAENQVYIFTANYDLNYAQDMEFDYNSDILFATLFTSDDQSFFVAIDKELGFVFEIDSMPNNYEITGLAFPHTWDFSGVKLISPDYNQGNIDSDQIFNWDNYPSATNYTFQLSLSENFDGIEYETNINTNSLQLPNGTLTLGLRYFWRVIAFNADTEIAQSPVWTFVATMPNYCFATSNNCDEYIGTLTFANINNVSFCNKYSNFLHIRGEVRQNKSYNIYVNNPVPYDGDAVGIFIDWNQNEIFDSPSEYYTLNSINNKDFYGVINVPADAKIGTTILRARIVYDEALSACGISEYGEVEDYLIDVLERIDEHTLYLNQGWNLISTYVNPISAPMEDIWAQKTQNLLIIKNNEGQVYIPSYNINNIGNWVLHQGYLAYLTNSDSLTIYGNICNPNNENINYINSWNNISYLRNSEMNAELAFTDLVSQEALLIAKNLGGQVYIPSYGINTIGNLKPGQGYKVYCTKSGTFKFPAN